MTGKIKEAIAAQEEAVGRGNDPGAKPMLQDTLMEYQAALAEDAPKK